LEKHELGGEELQVDLKNLYREEMFTDLKTGTIRRLTPVTAEGTPDSSRKAMFVGQTQVMTRAGPLPLDFELPGDSLEQAAKAFPAAVQKAVQEMVEQARELQREQASSLILPGQGPGKIHMP
jgi:hypothetical protein